MKNTAQFTKFTSMTNWVNGVYQTGDSLDPKQDYAFEAKLFDEPSEYGIQDKDTSFARISKIEIRYHGSTICNFDRGWDIMPAPHHAPAVSAILTLLANSPRRFDKVEG